MFVGRIASLLLLSRFSANRPVHASPTSTRTFTSEAPSHYRFPLRSGLQSLGAAIPRFPDPAPSDGLARPSCAMRHASGVGVPRAEQFARAIVSPILVPPITTAARRPPTATDPAALAPPAIPAPAASHPLMTAYLTDTIESSPNGKRALPTACSAPQALSRQCHPPIQPG